MSALELSSHFCLRALVFEDLRILYVPVPKASCTGILWLLAHASGLERERFLASSGGEVTPSLTIHDLSRWPSRYRFGLLQQEVQELALTGDGWLRFTVVRHPYARLWSAWQSKILLAEPQFLDKFSAEAWFPEAPRSSGDVTAGFRLFLNELYANPDLVHADVHWAPQVDLISYEQVSYHHVGHVEDLPPTLELLREHVRSTAERELPQMPRTNRNALPYVEQLYDETDAQALSRLYAQDLAAFGYTAPGPAALRTPVPQGWRRAADALVPALTELRERNARVHALRLQAHTVEESLAELRQRHHAAKDELERRGQQHRAAKEELKRRGERLRRLRQQQRERRKRDQAEIQRLRQKATKARRELRAVRQSASWRYTRPLRRVHRLIRRLGQRFTT